NPPGNHFLGTAHTLANFESAFYRSTTSDNSSYEQWLEDGGDDAAKRANKIYKERLASYVAPPLDDAIDEELKEFVAKRKSELPDTFGSKPSSIEKMSILSRLKKSSVKVTPAVKELVGNMRYELIPMKSIEQGILDLPAGAPVSVTCSPVKGISATQEISARLIAAGHEVVPHFAARLVESREHVTKLATWVREQGIKEVFLIAGDAENPAGPYKDGVELLRDFLDSNSGVDRVGFGSYPDGHAFISREDLSTALHHKQKLLEEAGVQGLASTQMCFDIALIRSWLEQERNNGFKMPIQLGVPGVVDRTRLMTLGVRVGVGQSMRYLSKNKTSIIKMLSPGGYDPTELVAGLAKDAKRLNIVGLHSFTFNSVADTAVWQREVMAS
ncbi:MAG: trimethylamine methyltransferase family protein, partial [Acidimicrobiaceae bacterium]